MFTEERNAVQFYLDGSEPVFEIKLQHADDDVEEKIVKVSECENFVINMWRREYQNTKQYKCFIYSLFEEHLIYETEWIGMNTTLKLNDQLQFNSKGTFFYQLGQTTLTLFEIKLEDKFFQIIKSIEHQLPNIHAIQWSPLANYLAVFQKSK